MKSGVKLRGKRVRLALRDKTKVEGIVKKIDKPSGRAKIHFDDGQKVPQTEVMDWWLVNAKGKVTE